MPVTTTGLSLASRKNIRDEFTNKAPELKKILKEVTGHDYEFSVDFTSIYNDSVKANEEQTQYFASNLGSIAFRYFESLIGNIKRIAQKDDLVRGDFVKLTENREIVLVHDLDLEEYNSVEVTDGTIYIKTRPSSFGTNVDAGYYLINQLKDTAEVLPVQTKKSIRDDWELKIPALKKVIKESLGESYEFVVNFDEIYLMAIKGDDSRESYFTSNLGSLTFDYFSALTENIKRHAAKDELVRNEILKLTDTRKIHLVIETDLEDYNEVVVVDGGIYIKVRQNSFGNNSNYTGYYLINSIQDPHEVLSLKAKKDVRDEWELKIPALKKQLKKVLGEDYEFEVDFDDVYAQVIKVNEDQKDYYNSNLGSVTFRYFESIVQNIEKNTKNDDLVRKEFLDLTLERKIVLVLEVDLDDYNDIEVLDGLLYIKVRPGSYGSNSSVGYYLVKKLHHPDSVLPVSTKKDIRDEWDNKIPELRTKLKKAVGEYYQFRVDFDDIYTTAIKNSPDDHEWLTRSLGDVTYGYFESLVNNIVRVTKDDDLVREGFLEVTENREFYLVHDSEWEDSSPDVQVKDGALYIRVKPGSFGQNRNYVGYNIIDKL
ncbi:hypothetical protein G9A89_002258 [Geosiphon pyriformis]|nr:hypothetical protein G9A89_002258 [Geosiphon pyriformis]